MKRKIKWTKRAKSELDHYSYQMSESSLSRSKTLKNKVLKSLKDVAIYPFMYQIEDRYINNKGDVRRFFCWDYRIIYQVKEKQIIVLKIVSTHSTPDNIND